MNKFCSNCGNKLDPNTNFCSNCGAKINNSDNENNYNYPRLPERNIVTCVILSILTCGLYGIYWYICMTDEANAVSREDDTSGGLAFLFTLLTCGLYGIYWSYRMGQKMGSAGEIYNKPIKDNGILYLILFCIGLNIVNCILIQNDLNRFSK